MKTQPKRSNYWQFSYHNAAFAIACALGIMPFVAPSTLAYAVADPVVEVSTVKPNAAGIYDFTNDTDVKNPFPNVITPDEVTAYQETNRVMNEEFPIIKKAFYTPSGKEFSVINGKATGDTREIHESVSLATINKYQDQIGRIDVFAFIPHSFDPDSYTGEGDIYAPFSSREYKNEDGSIDFDATKATSGNGAYSLEVNGKLIGNNLKEMTKLQYNIKDKQTFIHIAVLGTQQDETLIASARVNCGRFSAVIGKFAFMPVSGAQFHFVDDLQYRKVAHINNNDGLAQRSASDQNRFSTVPFNKIDLNDLTSSRSVTGVLFGNNYLVRNVVTPLLSFDGDPKKDKRPTMKELTSTNIPGYLYYSNDIDTPKDGTFTENNTEKFGNYDYGIVRDKDDNQLTTKHYYVTYRPIPTQLVVQYKNNDGSYKDASYSLLNATNSQVTGGFKASIANVAVPQKPALETMIKSQNTVLLSAGAGYVSDGLAYLAPGSYTVTPLAEAPDGYEWVVEAAQAAGTTAPAPTQAAAREAHITAPVHKDDTSALQQVVTFVLRKKIAPPPQPGPYPLPEPVPVPVPEVPALAATPEPERKVPVIEAPAPAAPAEAPAPIVRKRPRALPQTSDPMAISAVGELGMIFGVAAGSLAATLRRKRRNR